MKQDVAEAWVKDLRTTGAQQATNFLFTGVGYCCLGRLVVVLGKTFTKIDDETDTYVVAGSDETAVLTAELLEMSGIRTTNGTMQIPIRKCDDGSTTVIIELTDANDSGLTYPQIADIIEYAHDLL